MEHIITTLSFASLKSSNSYSFHPINALSIMTSWIGEVSNPLVNSSSKSFSSYTKEAPVPPRVNDALITRGNPNFWAISFPLRYEVAVAWGAIGIPMSNIKFLNCSLSSVILIAFISTPIIFTSKSSHIPLSSASIQRFNAVWPPMVGNTASIWGCSFKILTIEEVVSGNRYMWSAITGSVIIVAGLEFIKIVSIPSSLRDLRAWEPE